MADLAFLSMIVVFFLLTAWFVQALDKL